VRPGDDVAAMISASAGDILRPRDVLVVTHKILSKAEGRVVDLRSVEPSALARGFAAEYGKDARQVEVVLRESRRIVRMDRGVIIAETPHGFVCANAGVDASNVPGDDTVCLLPVDPDASARRLREAFMDRLGLDLPVIVSDSFGRAWRFGITDVAIGVSGMEALVDYRGKTDPHGLSLEASVLAVADEIAGAAELVMGKTLGVPAAIVRGYPYQPAEGGFRGLIMPPERDMFR
jgi:coenzyme F420-0:L-glutamate ligase/coenzyme F420-1:gamma-L-glutamate ligase